MAELHVQRLPAVQGAGNPTVALLPGWGTGADYWRPFLPWLRRRCDVALLDLPGTGANRHLATGSLEAALDSLENLLDRPTVLLGWSLGGMLAAELAARCPDRVAALVTVAANPCFVAREDWPQAMAPEAFRGFAEAVAADPEAGLRRFLGLQAKGADEERELLKRLRALPRAEATPAALHHSLDWLAALDTRAALGRFMPPALHLYGERDQLVPAGVAATLAASCGHETAVITGASHVPFLSHPDQSWRWLEDFFQRHDLLPAPEPPLRDKSRVALSFSSAAGSYDAAADLQRETADQLLSDYRATRHLQVASQLAVGSDIAPYARETVLDLGCGTGYVARQLAAQETVIGLDLAPGMLAVARAQPAPVRWLCADAENLPLADEAVDTVLSNLTVQWCERDAALWAEVHRVLRPGGRAFISTLGPATLEELAEAWRSVDARVHINAFTPEAVLREHLAAAGLRLVEWREQRKIREYPRARDLMRELKALGARNLNRNRPPGLTGRRALLAVEQAYEARRNAGGRLPATWQLWYLQVERPA